MAEQRHFLIWTELPTEHCGKDALAQLRVMARFGGCGPIPSRVYHQELPTTVEDRRANAPTLLPPEAGPASNEGSEPWPRAGSHSD